MTKNERVARFMGYNIGKLSGWLSGTSEIEYSYLKIDGNIVKPVRLDKLKYNSSYDWLHNAWIKFRDLKFDFMSTDFYTHESYCKTMAHKIAYGTITEALDELVKGIEWVESLTTKS